MYRKYFGSHGCAGLRNAGLIQILLIIFTLHTCFAVASEELVNFEYYLLGDSLSALDLLEVKR